MLILGINASYHDTSAAIVRDGQVLAALEEERINRVKHTNAFPINAIRYCLREAGAEFQDVNFVAVNVAEEHLWRIVTTQASSQVPPVDLSPQSFAVRVFSEAGLRLDAERLYFVPHHVAHAASAMLCSGFDEALVLSIDGVGDDSVTKSASGILFKGKQSSLERLRTMTMDESLGTFYGQITKLLGFREFDEYKVMGLAAYGNRETYRQTFAGCYTLTADGWYTIDRLKLVGHLYEIVKGAGRQNPECDKICRDLAAACQETLESIVLHILRYYKAQTGLTRLAMAGGVALNCSLNSKIATSSLFEDIFVQPASHDAGGAVGAALYLSSELNGSDVPKERLQSVYWGPMLPPREEIEQTLERWAGFIGWTRCDDIIKRTALRLSAGDVIAWVQARSEFGPRALGNRSILADPRPPENRDIINQMVKKRESFRPFAPSVMAEKACEYFDMGSENASSPFMLFLVPVRPEQREHLGAITHIDGTARVHTVTEAANPKFWELIRQFGDLTGIYMLLNTSFNCSAEPIVDTVEDAIITYLTTGLHYLVIDDYWITKREVADDMILDCNVAAAPCADYGITGSGDGPQAWIKYRHESNLGVREPVRIGMRTFEIMCNGSQDASLRGLLSTSNHGTCANEVLQDIRKLWWMRLIALNPASPRTAQKRCHTNSYAPLG